LLTVFCVSDTWHSCKGASEAFAEPKWSHAESLTAASSPGACLHLRDLNYTMQEVEDAS